MEDSLSAAATAAAAAAAGGGGRIPVFVFPSSLIFSGNERDHIKQILTIYNPYDFPVLFRVLSTTPSYYNVVEPEGSIQTKNCVDLIIRLTPAVPFIGGSGTDRSAPMQTHEPIESKFRVQVFHYTTKQPLGRKDVPSTIVFGNIHHHLQQQQALMDGVSSASAADVFLPQGNMAGHGHGGGGSVTSAGGSTSGANQRGRRQPPPQQVHGAAGPGQVNYVAIVTGLVCILGLMLPSEKIDDPSAYPLIPSYLHLTLNQKLLVAYTLGLVTMVIFRP